MVTLIYFNYIFVFSANVCAYNVSLRLVHAISRLARLLQIVNKNKSFRAGGTQAQYDGIICIWMEVTATALTIEFQFSIIWRLIM
jgi:hypothetical protein